MKLNTISGLPRAGTTLLSQIINSNPSFHSTPTSGVLDVLLTMKSVYSKNVSFKAQDRLELMNDITSSMRGSLVGYFASRGDKIFDKNRGWIDQILFIDNILGHTNTKFIWCYRDPIEILNSMEKQYRKTVLLENTDEMNGSHRTIDKRLHKHMELLDGPVEMLLDALDMGYGNRIIIIKYEDLCNKPQDMMDEIHTFIGEEPYKYDVDNIKQTTNEFDGVYNYKFPHKIKEGSIELVKGDIVIPTKYFEEIETRYQNLLNLFK